MTPQLTVVIQSLFWSIGTAGLFTFLGWLAIKFGPAGWRAVIYNGIITLLTSAAAIIAWLVDLQIPTGLGIEPTTIIAITFGGKIADSAIQFFLRTITTTPIGMDVHPAETILQAMPTAQVQAAVEVVKETSNDKVSDAVDKVATDVEASKS